MADTKKQIFREKALERLSSPDNIQELVQVTSTRSWLALIALGGLIFALLLWSFFGELPKTVRGKGILIQSGGIADITSMGSGIVDQVLVREGESVSKNDTIAIVAQPELRLQIENAQEKLTYLKEKRNRIINYTIKSVRKKQLLKAKYALEDNKQGKIKRLLKQQELKFKNLELLLQRKRIPKAEVDKAHLIYLTTKTHYDSLETVLQRYNQQIFALPGVKDQELETLESDINDLRGNISEMNVKFNLLTYIKSSYEGKVIELMAKKGQLVEQGAPIISLEVEDHKYEGLEAVIYIPPEDGKKVAQGMEVKIAPTTVKIEETGYIKGKVVQVSGYPSTKYGMTRILGNQELVHAFTGQDPPIAVFVALEQDSTAYSGYVWTTQRSPEIKINAGTLCSANIIIKKEKPIGLLIPGLSN
ncbi:NHLP bacteriocin system secretion protein [uncultured Microscilla sp.]|uniref:NHLP bacteriocin system secretion protein n=1 Tax=uncultured Microscilla sp. TaxID=432653 RepID=UPI002617DDE2|nr:NHLP bacteriocin system secretion protein [uncultured Microscilla sp.]